MLFYSNHRKWTPNVPNGQGGPPSQNATEENTRYYTRLGKILILVESELVRQVPPILASRNLVFSNTAVQNINSIKDEVTLAQPSNCGSL